MGFQSEKRRDEILMGRPHNIHQGTLGKRTPYAALALTLPLLCGQATALETKAVDRPVTPWYEKRRLTDTSQLMWIAANHEKKMSTAANWLRVSPVAVAAVQKEGDMNALRPFANKLVYCIDNSIESMHFTYESEDVATTCMALFGWLPDGDEDKKANEAKIDGSARAKDSSPLR